MSGFSAAPPRVSSFQAQILPSNMPAVGGMPTIEQVIAYLAPVLADELSATAPDPDDQLPPSLRRYAAGLRPLPAPAGVPWQQEIIYDRLARTDTEIAGVAQFYFRAAQNYDQYLARERITASQYYEGRPFGDEEKGRSQIVLTAVRDTIRATLPSLLRIFTGIENPVEFTPPADQDGMPGTLADALAREATDYARWALFVANHGWQILHDTLLDALTRRAGWVRWHWGALKAARIEECNGLLLPQAQALLAQPGVIAQRIVRRPMLDDELAAVRATPEGMQFLAMGGAPELYSLRLTRQAGRPWPMIEAVPTENVWVVADASTVETARGVFHVRDVTASDLIEQGLPEGKVMKFVGTSPQPRERQQKISRNQAQGYNLRGSPPNDPAMRIVRYAEGFIRMDTDGDHLAELVHVHMLGNATELIQWERTDEIPLACFTPYREPARIIGMSQADMVMDLQKTESRVMRATLDSLGQSIFPRTVAVVNQVNMADVRQTAIGSIIRASQQGAVTELTKPFLGDQALNVMQALETIRESRTGITRSSQGLTAEQLQSTAPIAVSAQMSASQDRIDMVARTLAETGLAPLYLGLVRMLARQQDRPNIIKIRGKWIQIDPRALAVMWAVSVNVGGKGTPAERMMVLAQVAAKQEQIIAQGGMNNPLCGLAEYRNTLVRMIETANISDPGSYFRELPPGWQPPPDPPPPPSSDQVLAGIEQQKTMANVITSRLESQTDRAKAMMEDDRDRDKAALDAWVAVYATAAQYGTPLPSLTEFRRAMKGVIAPLGLIPDIENTPAGVRLTSPPAPGLPVGTGRMPMFGMGPAPPGAPAASGVPPRGAPPGAARAPAPPPAGQDPATALAIRQAMTRGTSGMAMSALQNRASGLLGPPGTPPGV